MPTISEIRQQYPQYNDMSDADLAGALYKKYYSDMPREQFDAKIGFGAPAEESPSPAGPPVSTPQAVLQGLVSGASANFGDELSGIFNASGLPKVLGPLRAPVGAARLLYENTLGSPGEATSQYEAARDQERELSKAAREQHPGMFLGGEIGGALAMPVGRLGQGASLLGRMGKGALLGAGYGGLAGAGEGEDLEGRLKGAGMGVALGGALGGAAAPATDAALALGRAAIAPFRPLAGAIRPEAEAARRVASAIERDTAADPQALSRMTPTEIAATPTAANIDLGGETTRALARSAANTSPEARTALNQTLNPRYETQSDRVTEWLNSNFNFPNAKVAADALESTKRATNKTAYDAAYEAGAAPLATPEMARIAQSKSVQDAMKRATNALQDETLVAGGGKIQPYSTQYWDLVRRELSDGAQKAGYGSPEGRRLTSFANTINQELDKAVPEYQAARQGAKGFFQAENALEAGQNFVRLNKGLDEAKAEIAKMSVTEKKLFQDGFVSRYVETLNALPDRRNVLNSVAQSPVAREKIALALGPQKATELEAMMRVEGLMNLPKEAMGNSTSIRQLMELGLASPLVAGGSGLGGLGLSMYSGDPKHVGLGLLGAALLRGRYKVDQNVAQHVGRLLTSKDPQAFQQGVKMVASNKSMMDALRSVDMSIARAGGEQTQ
jgi:hypothetical protein